MTTPAQLPGLTSEHEFFSPIDDNFERDMEDAFRRATRGEIVLTPTTWPMGPYHTLEFERARSGVPMLPIDQSLNNPNGPWGGIKGSIQSSLDRRGLRGLGDIEKESGGIGLVAGGLLAAWALWMFTKDRESAFAGFGRVKRWVGAIYNAKTGAMVTEIYSPGGSREELFQQLDKYKKKGQTVMVAEGGYGDMPDQIKFNAKTGKPYKRS